MIGLGQCISQYNELLANRGSDAARRSSSNRRDRQLAYAYLDWCSDNDVDSESFMRFRFHIVKPPKFPALRSLPSSRLIEPFREWSDPLDVERHHEAVMARSMSRHEQAIYNVVVLSHQHRALTARRWHDQRLDLCRLMDIGLTLGFHPLSSQCPQCPEARACRAEAMRLMGYDVAALRSGQVDVLPHHLQRPAWKVIRELQDAEAIESSR